MRTIHTDEAGALESAASALRAGEVIVVPTDTVYGIAALPTREASVSQIYVAKDRPERLPLPVLAASLDDVRRLGVEFTSAAATLAARWWPGPLTLAFGFSDSATRPTWLDDRNEVAVRIPAHDFLLRLIRMSGVLVVTSANRHGEPTPASAEEAGQKLSPHISLVVDAGMLDSSPSTLVNVGSSLAVVEREGAIGRAEVAAALLDGA